MGKMAIICNDSDAKAVLPALILGSAAVASGEDVVMFFEPEAAPVLVKGALEKYRGQKGMPDPISMFEGIKELGGKFMLCELALAAKDIKKEDLLDCVEVVGATSFVIEVQDATLTFTFG